MNEPGEILSFVKAMASADRLRIVGLLSKGSKRAAEIAEALGRHTSVETGIKWQIACALEGYAGLAAHKQAQQALCLASFCNELRRSIHMPLSPIDRTLFERTMISAWQALDEKSTSEAQVTGQNMSLEDAVNFAHREVAFR